MEKETYPTLLARALLSSAMSVCNKPQIKIGNVVRDLGENTHHFGLRLMNMRIIQTAQGKYITHIDGKEVSASWLWSYLGMWCERLFPRALAEAIHMSKEVPKMGGVEFGYGFKSGEEEE